MKKNIKKPDVDHFWMLQVILTARNLPASFFNLYKGSHLTTKFFVVR